MYVDLILNIFFAESLFKNSFKLPYTIHNAVQPYLYVLPYFKLVKKENTKLYVFSKESAILNCNCT